MTSQPASQCRFPETLRETAAFTSSHAGLCHLAQITFHLQAWSAGVLQRRCPLLLSLHCQDSMTFPLPEEVDLGEVLEPVCAAGFAASDAVPFSWGTVRLSTCFQLSEYLALGDLQMLHVFCPLFLVPRDSAGADRGRVRVRVYGFIFIGHQGCTRVQVGTH